jgi:hypothetical protein
MILTEKEPDENHKSQTLPRFCSVIMQRNFLRKAMLR